MSLSNSKVKGTFPYFQLYLYFLFYVVQKMLVRKNFNFFLTIFDIFLPDFIFFTSRNLKLIISFTFVTKKMIIFGTFQN